MSKIEGVKLVSLGALAGLLLSLSACADQAPGADNAKSEADSTEQASENGATAVDGSRNAKGRFGPERMLREALSDVKLSAVQQKTIDATFAGLKSQEGFEKPAVFNTLADGVRKGSIDDAAVQRDLATMKASGDKRTKMVAAVQAVHDTLTPEQRAQVVSSVESRVKDKMLGGFGKHHDRDGDEAKGGHHRGFHGPMGKMLGDLALTDAQRTAFESSMKGDAPDHEARKAQREEMHTKMKAALEAFKADSFDASSALPTMGGDKGDHLARMVKAIETLTPLLDDKQRIMLADHLAADWRAADGKGGHDGPAAAGADDDAEAE